MSTIPDHLRYSAEHEWVAVSDGVARIGITEYAAEQLGDIVYAELPNEGDAVTAGEPCGELESTKSVSDLFSPVSGEVVAVNDAVKESPETVNSDPYGDGWLFSVRVDGDPDDLLDSDAYAALIKEGE
ncbi:MULTISPECIES: glycine cleavage system protein GcvH [unclassified Kutzneria]|uniref:glycine cleavage system protein GcvH n=1 Tax=unclassified Kutzneria TaxID=2621979 RepID=UPI0003EEDDE4|nr:glycine cleavage system protein GcvH [Kutzneria sp. 744]EWM15660.1 glycine cleavage system H protein [Kutzneria sp. 744]